MYIKYFKRLLDLIFAVILLPFCILFFIPISLLIYLEDYGPVFYISTRIKKNGKYFKIFKFRTMKVDSIDIRHVDGSTIVLKDDTRLTKIGKIIRESSIDEIPQLINIFLGDMSFVGPRPDLPIQDNMILLSVKPGITGYSQAYYRNNISYSEKIKLDIFYQNNVSFITDLRIVFITIKNIIRKKNIYKT